MNLERAFVISVAYLGTLRFQLSIPLTRFDGGGDDAPVFAFETPQE